MPLKTDSYHLCQFSTTTQPNGNPSNLTQYSDCVTLRHKYQVTPSPGPSLNIFTRMMTDISISNRQPAINWIHHTN